MIDEIIKLLSFKSFTIPGIMLLVIVALAFTCRMLWNTYKDSRKEYTELVTSTTKLLTEMNIKLDVQTDIKTKVENLALELAKKKECSYEKN